MKPSSNTREKANCCYKNEDCPTCPKETKPSQQECSCDGPTMEKGITDNSIHICENCQPPKSSEWEKDLDKLELPHYWEDDGPDSCSYYKETSNKECTCNIRELKPFIKSLLAQQKNELIWEINEIIYGTRNEQKLRNDWEMFKINKLK